MRDRRPLHKTPYRWIEKSTSFWSKADFSILPNLGLPVNSRFFPEI